MVNVESKAIIDSILGKIGVGRVISVDDKNTAFPGIDDILGHLQSLEAQQLENLLSPFQNLFSRDPEILSGRVREFWDKQDDQAKQTFLERIAMRGDPTGAEVAADAAAVQSLPYLFESWNFKAMDLPQWRAASEGVFAESQHKRTMILFDEDLSDQGGSPIEGLTLIKEALAFTQQEHVICCLLSHKYHMETIHDDWRRVCTENNFPEHRVVIIPKELLVDSPSDFAALIKLASVSQYYVLLKSKVQEIFSKSLEIATDKIQKLNIYDLDQIVFVSSDKEGVWEPDTLIRLLGIFHRSQTREKAISNEDLRTATENIRRISGVSTPITTPPGSALWQILHLENYEDEGPLNELHRPTDLGDIYERAGGRRYILIVPQCDLMVRTKAGFRGVDSDTIKEGIVAELVDVAPKVPSLGWKLDYYLPERTMYADFKKTFSVKLLCLDLCVFNSDGSAQFRIGAQPPNLLIPAWVKRHSVVAKQLQQILKTYQYIDPAGKQKGEFNRLLTKANNEMTFVGTVNPTESSINMNFKRVGRLLTPRSTGLLKAYGEFLNRDAFDHSFIV